MIDINILESSTRVDDLPAPQEKKKEELFLLLTPQSREDNLLYDTQFAQLSHPELFSVLF